MSTLRVTVTAAELKALKCAIGGELYQANKDAKQFNEMAALSRSLDGAGHSAHVDTYYAVKFDGHAADARSRYNALLSFNSKLYRSR